MFHPEPRIAPGAHVQAVAGSASDPAPASGQRSQRNQSGRTASRLLLASALVLTVVSQLGCVAAVVTGAAVGMMSAHDRSTLGAQTDDQTIEIKAPQRLLQAIRNSTAVNVIVFNRRALLVGQVLDETEKRAAEQAIARIENVQAVYNELSVGSGSTLSRQASDGYISTKVKASLIDVGGVAANHVKVVTEDGVVFLLGLVTRSEADRAAAVASRVSGVRKVVTLFETITEVDANRVPPSPAPWSAPARSQAVPTAPTAPATAMDAPAPPSWGAATGPVR